MIRADSVHSTPLLNASAINTTAGLDWIAEDAKPAHIFRAIGGLRKEARGEIDLLIRFLDETPPPRQKIASSPAHVAKAAVILQVLSTRPIPF